MQLVYFDAVLVQRTRMRASSRRSSKLLPAQVPSTANLIEAEDAREARGPELAYRGREGVVLSVEPAEEPLEPRKRLWAVAGLRVSRMAVIHSSTCAPLMAATSVG
jgi:hypothetical protein